MRGLMVVICLLAWTDLALAAPDVSGLWLTEEGNAAVDIQPCGEALCGWIAWLREPKDAAGVPQRDVNNPDRTLRDKPLCRLQILGGARARAASWEDGWIYDPEDGKRYTLALDVRADGALAVTGFVGVKMFGRTVLWHRAPADLPPCEGTGAKPRPQAPASRR